jgi:hypothetical protein
MKKLLLTLLIFSAGLIGFGVLRQATGQLQAIAAVQYGEWLAATNRLAGLDQATVALRDEVARKKAQLAQAPPRPNFSPELLEFLEGKAGKGHPAAWAELREKLEIGWNSSVDYVLVSKPILKRISFNRLYSERRASDTACAVMSLSPEEQAGIKAAVDHAREATISRVQRLEPAGDIVAQYTIQADPILEGNLSNQFSAEITAILDPERAGLFLPNAWREFKPHLAPDGPEPVTMTIRRLVADGEPKLVWELAQGKSVSSDEVLYAHYPSSWFLTLFPGGWQPIAEREGFELPKSFRN